MTKKVEDLTKVCDEKDEIVAKERKRAEEAEIKIKTQAIKYETELEQMKAKIQALEDEKAAHKC